MDITGKIIVACEPRVGVSQRTGNSWKMQEFVIETQEQYPRKCIFNVFGEDKLQEFNLKVGDQVKVYFDVDAREYNGRWFNDIRAWKVERPNDQQPAPASSWTQAPAQAAQPAAAPAPQAQQKDDDLPF